MKISVALCTYNGEQYLAEQLDSLSSQTRPPDELVVFDDGSNDSTCEQLERFAERSPFPVRIFRNSERVGPDKNFQRAISECRGDIVALSDQDDVWLPEKLQVFEKIFETSPEVGAVFCNADVTDEFLQSLGYDFWTRVGLTGRRRVQVEAGDALPALLKRYSVAGAMLAFRSRHVPDLLPVPPGWYYDAWLAIALTGFAAVKGIPHVLQKYRQHGENAVGGTRRSLLRSLRFGLEVPRVTYYGSEIERWELALDRLRRRVPPSSSDSTIAGIAEKLAHLRRRAALPEGRLMRAPAVVAELFGGGYSRFSTDWRSIVLDLFRQ